MPEVLVFSLIFWQKDNNKKKKHIKTNGGANIA
jgi:hypothetical protein